MKKILFFVITTLIFVPGITFAQRYLVDLPIDTKGSFNEYINLLYKMSISIAALLAVVKIIIAGAKYMLSDIVTTKGEAKKDIRGALLGLLLITGAVIILNTINPALTDGGLNIKKLEKVSATINPPPVAVPPTVGQTAANAQAAAAQAGSQIPPGCNQRTVTDTAAYTITVLDFSGCQPPSPSAGADLGAFAKWCITQNGKPDFSATYRISCPVAKKGTVVSSYGTVTQGQTYIVHIDVLFDNLVTKAGFSLQTIALTEERKCVEKFGKAVTSADYKTLTCTVPTVIQYTNGLNTAKGDCTANNGTFNTGTLNNGWSYDYCIIW